MKSWSTLFLALVALGLLAYLTLGGLEKPGTKEKTEQQSRVFNFDADKVKQLELTAGEGGVVLKKAASGLWNLEKPIVYPADLSNVRQVLGDFEFARRRETLPRKAFEDYDKALDAMGLKTPKVTVRIRHGKETSTLAIGNETARSGQFYALVSDGRREDLVIIERSMEEAALREMDWFRKREVFDFQTPLVTGIVLRKGEQETELVRSGDLWSVTKPLASPADETQVLSYLAELLAGKVSNFVADSPGDSVGYGLSTPMLVLEIKSGDQVQRLRVSQPVAEQEQVYAQINGRPQVVGLSKAYVEKLEDLLARTQDRRLLVFQDPFEWDSFRAKGKGTEVVVRQTAARIWTVGEDPGRVGETTLVNNFLNALRDLRALQILPKSEADLAKWGLQSPATVLSFSRKSAGGNKETSAPEEISFSAARKGKIYATSTRLPFVAELPESSLVLLPNTPSDWYEKKVSLQPDLAGLKKITWQRPTGRLVLERGEDGAWPTTLAGRPLDSALFTQQQTILAEMRVASWVPVKEADFTRPRFSMELESKDGSRQTVDFALMGQPPEYRGRVRGTGEMFVVRGSEPGTLENPPFVVNPPAAEVPGKAAEAPKP
jgi:hypothetical protein